MTIKASVLRQALPLIKEYSQGRGVHVEQPFPNDQHAWTGNAPAAWIDNGVLTRYTANIQYCTGQLFNVWNIGDKKPIILVQVQPCWPDLSIDAFNAYIKWLTNDSPWSDAFISKNINRILKDGVMVIDGTQNRAFVKEAVIASRMAWENYHKNGKYREIGVWYELSQKVHPNIAYVVAKLLTTVQKGNLNKLILKQAEQGHAPINANLHASNMHVNGWLIKKRARGGDNVWSYKAKGPPSITQAVLELINSFNADEKKANPFDLNSSSKEFDRKKFIEAMHDKLPALEERYFNVKR